MGGWPSRTLTRHGMAHPWQFHGWAAANFPRTFIGHSEIIAVDKPASSFCHYACGERDRVLLDEARKAELHIRKIS